jgi:hypothetical protein
MKELSDQLYHWLYQAPGHPADQSISLRAVGLIVGALLVATHLIALLRQEKILPALSGIPRSMNLGTLFLTISFLWAWMVATSMDLGEFGQVRWLAQFALPVFYIGTLFIANDYLGARSIGIFLLLAACPVLGAAWQKAPQSRLLLSALAYVWIILGLFWVGMPFTMRDQIKWLQAKPGRFRLACFAGIAYGALVLAAALLYYGAPATA